MDDRQVWNASGHHKVRRIRDQIANDKKSGSTHARNSLPTGHITYILRPSYVYRQPRGLSTRFRARLLHPGIISHDVSLEIGKRADYSSSEVSCSARLPNRRTGHTRCVFSPVWYYLSFLNYDQKLLS